MEDERMTTMLGEDSTEDTVLGLIPYLAGDDKKASYLTYRACGFGVREAAELSDVTERSVRRWRQYDKEFARLDGVGLAELRNVVGLEITAVRFARNLTLVLELDYNALKKLLTQPDTMTREEKTWAKEARKFYTPQQMEALKRLAVGSEEADFNYDQFILSVSRSQTIRLKGTKQ